MTKSNLIKLGAWAQKRFDMKDNFRVMEIASDAPSGVRVRVPFPMPIYGEFAIYLPAEFDEVELEKFGSQDNFEFIWCGYAPSANVLVIQDRADIGGKA